MRTPGAKTKGVRYTIMLIFSVLGGSRKGNCASSGFGDGVVNKLEASGLDSIVRAGTRGEARVPVRDACSREKMLGESPSFGISSPLQRSLIGLKVCNGGGEEGEQVGGGSSGRTGRAVMHYPLQTVGHLHDRAGSRGAPSRHSQFSGCKRRRSRRPTRHPALPLDERGHGVSLEPMWAINEQSLQESL
jgi:hypothetical protein